MNRVVLGLDIGFKRTGVALSQSGVIAQPLTVITASPPHMESVISEIICHVDTYGVEVVVVGLPLSESSAETKQSEKVQDIIQNLKMRLQDRVPPVEVVVINEFHTTKDARELYPTTDPDSAAAALILQDYLEQGAF